MINIQKTLKLFIYDIISEYFCSQLNKFVLILKINIGMHLHRMELKFFNLSAVKYNNKFNGS